MRTFIVARRSILHAFPASLLALAIASAAGPLAASDLPAPPATPAKASPAAAPVPSVSATVYDVVVELGRTETMRRQIAGTLRVTSDWKALAAPLDDPEFIADLAALEAGGGAMSRIRYLELVDADTRIRDRVRAVGEASAELGALARKVEDELERLEREAARWPQRAALVREHGAPPEIQRKAEAAATELGGVRERLRARRDELLLAYERGVALQARLDAVRAAIAERRERISNDLRLVEYAPVWRQGPVTFPRDEVTAAGRLARLELAEYLRHHARSLGALFGVLVALMFIGLRSPRAGVALTATVERRGVALAGAFLASLVLLAVLAPRGPFIFYRLVGLVAPVLAGFVATRTFAAPIPATVWTLVFAVILNETRVLAEINPGFGRLLLAMQLVPFAIALVHDWRRGALARFLAHWRHILRRRSFQLVLLALVVTAAANLLGYAGVARVVFALAVVAPGFMLVFGTLAWVLDHVVAGILATPLAQTLHSVRERADAIRRVLHVAIVLFCWATGIFAFMMAHAAFDDLLRLANFVANASVSAGEVTITFSAVLSALVIIVVTWAITKFVRFLLDYELLPRLDLRTGVPIAISTIVSYVLVLIGFVLALAALGIDLTKVTLLAGALGVGVGLGLQNVVNNFASGLILMVERPVNVGDQIDVGGVVGEVKRIGVRSSTIRTPQGAEVIIPNSDLASKQVTNWTLSDRARRYEIDVGVAYGSDPAQVLILLERAAALVPEVQKVPPPRALFVGFGNDSLDFRLFAWVGSVDIGMQAQNDLRMTILRLLDEAGIGIPFERRELHIRYAPAAATGPAPITATSAG